MVVPGASVASRLGAGPGTVVDRDDATPGSEPVLFGTFVLAGTVETLTSSAFAQPDVASRVTITTTLSRRRPARRAPERWTPAGR